MTLQSDMVGSCNKGLEKLMLGFLSSTKLPRRVLSHGIILSVLVESETSEHDVTEQLTPEYKDYMKSIEVNIPQLRKVRDMTERMRLLEREQLKDIGYHFRDYSWFSPGISIFICDCNELLALKVVACEEAPRIRFCNGCNDVFINTIDITHYPSLAELRIWDMHISGGRLRRFIKEYGATLKKAGFFQVSLTDGSWRSIAQGLQKLPLL
ncbi:hypothetical protein CFE70_010389 [Pyrenophora teres f. teres 0-1]